MLSKYNFGLIGELISICIYCCKFYRILHRRYRNYAGEIDLICKKGNLLVFIEVKARYKCDLNMVISQKQIMRITKAAQLFIAFHPEFQKCDIRFDLVMISKTKLPQIIKNAW